MINVAEANKAKTVITHRRRSLTAEDLQSLGVPLKIQGNYLIIERSRRGWKLKKPVKVELHKVLAVGSKGLVKYILESFSSERPSLVPFAFNNNSVLKLAKHFLRHCSGSLQSLYSYTNSIEKYSKWLGHSPDTIIRDVKPQGNIPDPQRVQNHVGFLEDFVAEMQDEGLSPGRVHCLAKHIKTFYRVNRVKLELTEPLSRRVTYKDRAPTAEELTRILDIAPLREKVIVTMLALGAFREETLARLEYRHVKHDLENNVIPSTYT